MNRFDPAECRRNWIARHQHSDGTYRWSAVQDGPVAHRSGPEVPEFTESTRERVLASRTEAPPRFWRCPPRRYLFCGRLFQWSASTVQTPQLIASVGSLFGDASRILADENPSEVKVARPGKPLRPDRGRRTRSSSRPGTAAYGPARSLVSVGTDVLFVNHLPACFSEHPAAKSR